MNGPDSPLAASHVRSRGQGLSIARSTSVLVSALQRRAADKAPELGWERTRPEG